MGQPAPEPAGPPVGRGVGAGLEAERGTSAHPRDPASAGADAAPGARHRPVGLLAALLAAALTVGGLMAGQAYALRLAETQVRRVAFPPLPIKFETLTLQRAALASPGVLPLYGSSELFCCGAPDIGSQFFAHAPTGFAPFSIGRAGTADLFFLETFGALGGAVAGRRLVLSVSPVWFFGHGGVTPGYDGNFSPEIADVFVWDAPLPLGLRSAVARQMLPDPRGLGRQTLARWGAELLADPTPAHLLAYYALLPAGRLDAWAWKLRDAWQTLRFIWNGDRQAAARSARPVSSRPAPSRARPSRSRPASPRPRTAASHATPASPRPGTARPARLAAAGGGGGPAPVAGQAPRASPPSGSGSAASPRSRSPRPRSPLSPPARTPARRALLARLTAAARGPVAGPIDWVAKLSAATRLQAALAAGDPFGFAPNPRLQRQIEPALRLYCSGRTNRNGTALPYPTQWVRRMSGSTEWTDLALELRVLRQLGARALVWSVAMPGVYYDYTPLSVPARRLYYRRFERVTAGTGFPAVDFASLDQNRLEVANTGSHFSPRGWVLADRVLDLFWHGQAARIPADLAALTRAVPSPGPPPPPPPGTC